MGKIFDAIPDNLIEWIKEQEVFWVSTAPLSADGHLNISPKGVRGSFVVEGSDHVWYEDLSGSGCETIAHIRENGRITICFNALSGAAQIVRLYGKGTVLELGSEEYNALLPPERRKPGSRAIIDVRVHRVSTSCGFGVPYYKFEGHRVTMLDWLDSLEKKDKEFDTQPHDSPKDICKNGMRWWWDNQNRASIDGLPALERAIEQKTIPLGGKMPDPVEAGMKVREPRKDEELKDTEKGRVERAGERALTKGVDNGNLKLAYGVVLGFLLSFLLKDVIAVARTFIPA